ncbi:M4 family metallopeptidase [Streptomyces sp. NPDC087917]
MRSTTDYARTATLQAASGLYGPSSPEVARVAAAWTAVNVR